MIAGSWWSSCTSLCTSDLSMFREDGKKLSRRKVGLHFAGFSWFELRKYAMKGKSKGSFLEVLFIIHWSGSYYKL